MKKLIVSISLILICFVSCKEVGNSGKSPIPEAFYRPEVTNILDGCLKTVDTIIFMPQVNMKLISVDVVDTTDNNRLVGHINAFSSLDKALSIGDKVELLKVRYMIGSDSGYKMAAIIK